MSGARGRPFQPGNQVGRGRPKGSKNKKTPEHLIHEHAELLVRKCIQLAVQGNPTALRLLLERVMGTPKGAKIQLRLPPTKTPQEVIKALDRVIQAVGTGLITPDHGATLTHILEKRLGVLSIVDLEERLQKLESVVHRSAGDGYPPWATEERIKEYPKPGVEEGQHATAAQDRAA